MSSQGGTLVSFLTSRRLEASQLALYGVATLGCAIVVHLIIRIAQLIWIQLKTAEKLKDFPIVPGHWFWGNLKQFTKDDDRMYNAETLARDYPKACVTRLSPFFHNLRLHHPDVIKAITNTTEPKEQFAYSFIEPWIGQGLLVSHGRRWARNRRLLTPAFHFEILKPYVRIFSQSAHTMVTKLKNIRKKQDEPLEMFHHVSLMTLDGLMKCIFGFQGDCQQEGFKHPYIQGVSELVNLVIKRFLFFPYYNNFLYNMSWSGYKFRRACALVHTYSRDVISRRRQEYAQNKDHRSDRSHIDFLDMLLEAKDEDGQGLTDAEIQAEVDTFMFEGHDTTASGISWCLYNLARHPEYQAKCREEVNSVLGDRQHFEWDDIHKLPFLTMCVKESLRLHPPVPSTGRTTTRPVPLPDGRVIPAGVDVVIAVFSCHHNPTVWEKPQHYDPYRFTPENSKGRDSHAFIPFSAGPRNCIGQHFALHEMKVSIGQVLRHFELHDVKDKVPVRVPLVVLKAKGGLYVKLSAIAT